MFSYYHRQLSNIIINNCESYGGCLYFEDQLIAEDIYNIDKIEELPLEDVEKIAFKIICCDTENLYLLERIADLKNILFCRQNVESKDTEIIEIKTAIDKINDNMQTFTEVTNLFTDVDKNRNNIDDEIKKVNNRLDKLEQMLMKLLEKD